MKDKLIKLLDNCYNEIDAPKVSSIIVMKDGKSFSGVSVYNNVYRCNINAGTCAITKAITNGYKKYDFEKIYFYSNDIRWLKKHLPREVIEEFFEELKEVIIIDEFDIETIYKVSSLKRG